MNQDPIRLADPYRDNLILKGISARGNIPQLLYSLYKISLGSKLGFLNNGVGIFYTGIGVDGNLTGWFGWQQPSK